ncbi:MAG: CHRD domain-containing protein [Coleofasciculaceae cyanobacterium SM2_1_6]|nr:CHRD domain-containing protein [Coleofasciculaceae cyanobacterium SM2_1_6]
MPVRSMHPVNLASDSTTTPVSWSIDSTPMPLDVDRSQLATDQQQAQAVLMAQGSTGQNVRVLAAVLTGREIYPLPAAATRATGAIGAALAGDRLVGRGSFPDLSTPLRDYATDSLIPPSPNITSAAHIHRGTAADNESFQYALTVELEPSGLNGKIKGEYMLTTEQIQALGNDGLYVDMHTRGFRGMLKPY